LRRNIFNVARPTMLKIHSKMYRTYSTSSSSEWENISWCFWGENILKRKMVPVKKKEWRENKYQEWKWELSLTQMQCWGSRSGTFLPDLGSGIFTARSGSGSSSGVYLSSTGNCFQKDVLNQFFEKLSWYRHHVKIFTVHYVNGINWRIDFLKWIWIRSVFRGWIQIWSRSKPDWIPNTAQMWDFILDSKCTINLVLSVGQLMVFCIYRSLCIS
jgi:hypothetical protein